MITQRNVAFCLIFSMALVLLDQLQTFWQLCLIELLGLFNKAGAIRAVALDISKAFNWVWHPDLLHQLSSYGISGQTFGLISSFFSNRWLWVVLDGKYSQKYPVNAGVPQGSTLGPTLFLLYINDLPDVVICNILIMDIIFSDVLIFYQIFFSLQVKWSVIISNKHRMHKIPHKLLNNLRLWILGNQERSGKSQSFIEL